MLSVTLVWRAKALKRTARSVLESDALVMSRAALYAVLWSLVTGRWGLVRRCDNGRKGVRFFGSVP